MTVETSVTVKDMQDKWTLHCGNGDATKQLQLKQQNASCMVVVVVMVATLSWKGNMGLYVHRNHEGLLGTGKLGVEASRSNIYSLHCHHQSDYAKRWAAVSSILMFH